MLTKLRPDCFLYSIAKIKKGRIYYQNDLPPASMPGFHYFTLRSSPCIPG